MQYMKSLLRKCIVYILTVEARILLKRFKPKIVAVTGSVGKTSTKDAMFSVLAGTYKARKSDKSFNSEIGIPLTVLGLKNPWNNPIDWLRVLYEGAVHAFFTHEYPDWLVLEVGADHPGDIGRVVKWIQPDVAVLTAVPNVPVHVEYFPSVESVLLEKRKLIDAVKDGGLLIIDGDCEQTAAIAKKLTTKVYTFGFSEEVTAQVTDAAIVYDDKNIPTGMEYSIKGMSDTYHISVENMIGAHLALPIAAAVVLAEHNNISKKNIESRLSTHETPQGRMRLLKGANDTILIDDTYNASPYAAKAALASIRDLQIRGKRHAVLGDMSELGKHAGEAHADVGVFAASIVDVLYTVGARARGIAEAARSAGLDPACVHEFGQGEWDAVVARIRSTIMPGDALLIKGSQSTRLEKIVLQLLDNLDEAHKLVRQDEEWKKR